MSTVTIASNHADAEAAEKVEQHHAEMAGRLDLLTADVVRAARTGHADSARQDLLSWLRDELVPHATAEERTLYPAARQITESRLLVEAMLAEHVLIHRLVADLEAASDPVEVAALARALETVFDSHLAKENDQLIPTLVASPDYSVAEMLAGMHELLGGRADHGEDAQPADVAHGGHQCACGGHDEAGLPELDVRVIPHAIRHATIFGALDGLRPGAGLLLVADHDPLPLLAQLEQRTPGAYAVDYRDAGPDVWRLELVRRA
ncbi:cation-binding protein [Nocardioides sp. Soil774]|nr:cation-binding protein [Nocardioides sp. Soil774]